MRKFQNQPVHNSTTSNAGEPQSESNVTDECRRERELLESMPVPVVVYRAVDGKILFSNSRNDALFGEPTGGLVDRDSCVLFPNVKERRKLKKKFDQTGRVSGDELSSRRANGEEFLISVWQTRKVCGGIECVLCIVFDISEFKAEQTKLEEQLLASRQLLRLHEHDRETIAYEIHDGIIQDITAAAMHLEAAMRALSSQKKNVAALLETCHELLKHGIDEGRQLIDGVQPPDCRGTGIVVALKQLVKRLSRTTGIDIKFEYNVESDTFPQHLETAMYRIIQESLNNVWRHSKSPSAHVQLVEHADRIEAVVTDWGVGFDRRKVGDLRFGLTGLQRRVQILGGTVAFEHAKKDGTGTKVKVSLPLGEAVDAAAAK